MKLQINEIAKLAGVSVRTLHYYDEIGLLKPSKVDEQNGYRFYDEKSIEKLQQILFYRELDFSLKSISEILSSPDYDRKKALSNQRNLLTLKKQRIERLIEVLDNAQKGEISMNFNAFDNTEYNNACEKYAKEVKEKWGNTDAYKDYENKCSDYSKEKFNRLNDSANAIFAEFATCKADGYSAESEQTQSLVKKWQAFVTENYYDCTKEILAGLGQMYIADERFKKNLDNFGNGNAEFISNAIEFYCK